MATPDFTSPTQPAVLNPNGTVKIELELYASFTALDTPTPACEWRTATSPSTCKAA
jgi:hypothetical protein